MSHDYNNTLAISLLSDKTNYSVSITTHLNKSNLFTSELQIKIPVEQLRLVVKTLYLIIFFISQFSTNYTKDYVKFQIDTDSRRILTFHHYSISKHNLYIKSKFLNGRSSLQVETIPLIEDYSKWWYLDGNRKPALCWKDIMHCPINWEKQNSEPLPPTTSNVTYYTTPFTIESLDKIGIADLSVIIRGGMIIYINGKEVYRVHVPPDVTRDPSIVATSCFSPEQTVEFSISIYSDYFIRGVNVISIESYRCPEDEKQFPLNLNLTLKKGMASLNRVSTHFVSVPSISPWSDEAAFDDNDLTFFATQSACDDITFTFQFNMTKRFFICGYRIAGANRCLSHHPTGWQLYAKRLEENEYILLHEVKSTAFDRNEIKTFFFSLTEHYFIYQLRITQCANIETSIECSDRGIFFAGISLLSGYNPDMCLADNGFPSTSSGIISRISCDLWYASHTSYRQRACIEGKWGEEENHCIYKLYTTLLVEDTSPFIKDEWMLPSIVRSQNGVKNLSYTLLYGPPGLKMTPDGVLYGVPSIVYDGKCQFHFKCLEEEGKLSTSCNTVADTRRNKKSITIHLGAALWSFGITSILFCIIIILLYRRQDKEFKISASSS